MDKAKAQVTDMQARIKQVCGGMPAGQMMDSCKRSMQSALDRSIDTLTRFEKNHNEMVSNYQVLVPHLRASTTSSMAFSSSKG